MAELPQAILFDLDDTILASGQRPLVLLKVAEELCSNAGVPPEILAQRIDAALEAYWSDPVRHKEGRLGGLLAVRTMVVSQVFAELQEPRLTPQLAEAFAARFTVLREELLELFPTARETIEALKGRGVKLALVTNGAAVTQRAKIEQFDLAPLFDHVQIEGEHGFGKPETQAYRHALEALGVEPHETWMVGDNLEWEVAAPQRLGITGIWHDHLGVGLPSGSPIRPDRIIRTLGELLT